MGLARLSDAWRSWRRQLAGRDACSARPSSARSEGEKAGRRATTAWSAPRPRRAPRNWDGRRSEERRLLSPAIPTATPTPCTARRRWCWAASTAMAAIRGSRGDAALQHDDPRLCRRARPGARAAALSRQPGTSRRAPIRARTYTLLNREAPEYVRFVNPSDYRVVARQLRRLPYRGDRGGGALADGDRRDAVGRRGL